MNKIIPLISITLLVVAVLLSLDCMAPTRLVVMNVFTLIFRTANKASSNGNPQQVKVFSKEELSKFKGENGGKIYLSVAGSVFDVTKGRKHYGPDGGYSFFAGVDGSKAFVTGNFDSEGLTDDISTLSNAEVLSLDNWKSFYEKDYSYVGVLEGSFYNKKGEELDMMRLFKKKLKLASLEKDVIENDKKLFPPCNSEWSQQNGGRVWCSNLSGGIKRDWEGVPRMYYTAGSQKPRCACVKQIGPPSHDPKSQNHKNNGDLDNPNLNLYPGCEPSSKSCILKD